MRFIRLTTIVRTNDYGSLRPGTFCVYLHPDGGITSYPHTVLVLDDQNKFFTFWLADDEFEDTEPTAEEQQLWMLYRMKN